jgi:hypothetical protein
MRSGSEVFVGAAMTPINNMCLRADNRRSTAPGLCVGWGLRPPVQLLLVLHQNTATQGTPTLC